MKVRNAYLPIGLILLAATAFADGLLFDTRLNHLTEDDPWTVCSADFDGDGDNDLAVSNWHGNISIMLNDGDGVFHAADNYGSGWGVSAVFPADLDGDGDCDLAAAISGLYYDYIRILLNNGDATFEPAGDYATGKSPLSVVAADFDLDGDADLAVAINGTFVDRILILLNDGNGIFQADANYEVGDEPWSICAADFDGDADYDLAVANSNFYGKVAILLSDGDGTFKPAVNYAVGKNPRSVCAADFDNDGDYDVAVANEASDSISVLANTGDGTFEPAVNHEVDNNPCSIFSADFDRDGSHDLAVANSISDCITILLNSGGGVFSLESNYTVGDIPHSVWAADFDGDECCDVAVVNRGSDNISILHNRCDSIGTSVFEDRDIELLARSFQLAQNYPNPFNSYTSITYEIPVSSEVVLSVYNLLGRKVVTLVDATESRGRHTAIWDGRDSHGRAVPSGLYFYRLHTTNNEITRKMLLLK